jgi:hypothetical protein
LRPASETAEGGKKKGKQQNQTREGRAIRRRERAKEERPDLGLEKRGSIEGRTG